MTLAGFPRFESGKPGQYPSPRFRMINVLTNLTLKCVDLLLLHLTVNSKQQIIAYACIMVIEADL